MSDLLTNLLKWIHVLHTFHVWYVLLLFLGLAPLLIGMTIRFKKFPTINLIEDLDILPSETYEFFQTVREQLTDTGFKSQGIYCSPDAIRHTFFVCELYTHDIDQVALLSSSIYGQVPNQDSEPLQSHYSEFLSEFHNQKYDQVLTNDQVDPGSFLPSDRHYVARLAQIDDVRQLYQYHQKLIRSLSISEPSLLSCFTEFAGDIPAYIQDFWKEPFDREVAKGTLRLKETNPESESYYYPTVMGAYILTWKELWPMKPMRIVASRRAGLKLQNKLDFG